MPTKTCSLTGVGRAASIAHGVALALADDGWDLAIVALEPTDDVAALAAEIEQRGRRALVQVGDLADPAVPERLVAEATAELGPVTALVLSHAVQSDSTILDTTLESFDRHVAVNTRAAWLLMKAFAERLPPVAELADGARVVAMTSDHTVGNLPYGASKGALDRIVIAAARELAPLGVSSNAINPGPVDTGWMDDETRATLTAMQPTGRLGTPGDAASLVRFLLAPEGRWVTGQLIGSDGGFSS
ncbi:3-oxoacyl-[acyl-carrier protein] reductase [Frigoribacterium sp. PhB160]|uniref:SDR family NAD(P)-dependent oxidoreductase n=1 Tax=Frigoribacterium sp. PhB160 TaxID=2485192 RepID=UPI000F49B8BC|nr:SDR family oxidoreductase [Frigoribacterium sp. PhB160]ROS59207.1 3-oxoacyl-[acyl-carrier protein] reductase [Frigoribacterium sp. PhB160]